ncbi:hypothetical protein SSX86_014046 [Deinandra increscens subsp. villosa]|uniref:Pheromone receptor n=1 Tax=Deinandra increscens subsp. villosa TaxID=3103831 RepID=A0AAP0D5C4_9ASTR
MEVVTPHKPTDFDFNSSAYANAPSTPKFTGDYYNSAPTSPARIPDLYTEFEELYVSDEPHRTYSLAAVPFAWEEKPGVPKPAAHIFERDFAFDVSGELYRDSSVSAEELFRGGVIKPAEIEQPPPASGQVPLERERGRERTTNVSSYGNNLSSSRSRRTRSLPPPFRGSEQQPPAAGNTAGVTSSTCTTLAVSGSGKGSKKWSFMDLFLFRSASDGRAMDRDPLKKYSSAFRKHDEDFRNSMSRGDGSGSGSGSKRRGLRVSAHELHYTVNRAVSNDMKKKTFLPYKQGILGRLAFNPTVHALSNGFGYSHNN